MILALYTKTLVPENLIFWPTWLPICMWYIIHTDRHSHTHKIKKKSLKQILKVKHSKTKTG